MLPSELTKDTPYLALSGELWSVFYEYFNRYWPCYKGFLLYVYIYHYDIKNDSNNHKRIAPAHHRRLKISIGFLVHDKRLKHMFMNTKSFYNSINMVWCWTGDRPVSTKIRFWTSDMRADQDQGHLIYEQLMNARYVRWSVDKQWLHPGFNGNLIMWHDDIITWERLLTLSLLLNVNNSSNTRLSCRSFEMPLCSCDGNGILCHYILVHFAILSKIDLLFINTLRPRQNERDFADDIFKWFF